MVAISLGRGLPHASSGLPGGSAGHLIASCLSLLQAGVAEPARSPGLLVGSYPTFSPLLAAEARCGRFVSVALSTGRPVWVLPSALPFGGRTFLEPDDGLAVQARDHPALSQSRGLYTLPWLQINLLGRKGNPRSESYPAKDAAAMGTRVVCIGGGTGLATLLKGLKPHLQGPSTTLELAAIVTVSDDGGSSGRLIEEFGVLPPGDIRNCLIALSEQSESLQRLLEYRFPGDGPLAGHSVGNLLLVALTHLNQGNFAKAVEEAAQILAVRGRILPSTLEPTVLCAELQDGEVIVGESRIAERFNRHPIRRVFLSRREDAQAGTPKPFACPAHDEAVQALEEAEVIILGPGSLYTSLLPNLVVPGIAEAFRWSKGRKIFVANLMNEPGETDGYTLTDHWQALRRHANVSFDIVLVNRQPASPHLLQQYLREELQAQFTRIRHQAETALERLEDPEGPKIPLQDILANIQQLAQEVSHLSQAARVQLFYRPQEDALEGAQVVEADLLTEMEIWDRGQRKRVLRHDPARLAACLMEWISPSAGGGKNLRGRRSEP